jgi:hypothetical protein
MSSVLAAQAVKVGAATLVSRFFDLLNSTAGQQAILKVLMDKKTKAAELDAALAVARGLDDPQPPVEG